MITKRSLLALTPLCVVLLSAATAPHAQGALQAQYEFEGNLNDSSGNGHTGTFLAGGGASIVVDPDRGNVLEIDGSIGSGVDIGATVPIPNNVANTSFTLAAWVKLNNVAASNTEEYILQIGRNGDQPIVTLGIATDFVVRSYSETTGTSSQVTLSSASPVEASAPFANWHHVAVVYDRATDLGQAYIDGLPSGSGIDISALSDTEPFTWSGVPGTAAKIGTEGDIAGASFDGLLDDVRFYDHALTDTEILEDVYGVLRPIPVLHVNRITGEMFLENRSDATGAMAIQGYSITSTRGALDQSQWNSVTDNGDAGNGGPVDTDDDWTILSANGSFTDLSEFQFGGSPGDGGSVPVGGSIDLSDGGRTWLPSPDENDLSMEIAYADGSTEVVEIVYVGNGDVSLKHGDLNHDGAIGLDDWLIFKPNNQTDMSSLSAGQSYLLGDLDGDLDSDIYDFLYFQHDYDAANGAGSFAAMLQSVPEPASLLLMGLAGLSMLAFRRFRGPLIMRTPLIFAAVIASVSFCSSQQVKADPVFAQFDIMEDNSPAITVHASTGVDVIAHDEPNTGDITYKVDLGGGLAKVSQNDGMLFANMNQFQYDSTGDRNVVEVAGDLTHPGTGGAFADSMWFSIYRVSGGGSETNADIATAFFPFADGWIAGHVDQDGTLLAGNTGAVTVTVLPNTTDSPGGGFFELSIAGVNTLTDGLLFAVGASNEDNYVSTGSPDSTKWSVIVRDEDHTFNQSEPEEWSFVYIPYDTEGLVAAASVDLTGDDPPAVGTYSNGAFTSTNSVGNFTMERLDYGPNSAINPPSGTPDGNPDTGRMLLKIEKPGGGFYSDADGMLMLNPYKAYPDTVGGVINKADDNMVCWEYDESLGGFVLESYDMGGAGLQNSGFAFAFFEYDKLKLLVHPVTGELVLYNPTDKSFEFNSYQVTSPNGALLTGDANWNSLNDQDIDSLGGGEGENWEESGGVSANTLAELFLLGNSDLAPGEWLSLGQAYDPGVGDSELSFYYTLLGSGVGSGDVTFIVLGDMNGDGELTDADVNPFVEALTDRMSFETNNPGVLADFVGDFDGNGQLDLGDVAGFKAAIAALPGAGSASAVPEPSTFALLALALGLLGYPSRGKRLD